ncbi:hypothetical protein COCMIDRAFT_30736 [Bipolaris oryzae ATCC 44560]|uniref:Uncharacterized protein n=1 Tax=Bipolaris oryzae ATCC 44560 TaxID=930090 RepID=W6YRQ9_COCMI|nr:uncharacterized protein COCMIDRAFT_30736 [Bipolaris oryzae ATCC 44560]EUC40305.1 hypothetical protein COCMIDRAFT_30736 [Bipolaris oryzae ATCC 44560]
MSSPRTTTTTQAPSTQEIETSFIRVLSNGPLNLETITDRMNGFGEGHEDAVAAVFEYMVEAIEGEGGATYQLRPEYHPSTTTTITNPKREEVKEEDFTPTLLRTPPTNTTNNEATPTRKTPPAPLFFVRSPAPSPQLSSPLSSPPTHLSSPASSLPPRPRPRYTSSPLSSPPPTSELRSPTPPPARSTTQRRTGPKGKGTAASTATATATSSRMTKKSNKAGAAKKKGGGMEKVQCSGVTKRKTRCGFKKMCEVGQRWDCGRHG